MTIISDARVAATLKKAMHPKELVDQLDHLSSRVTALTECIKQRDDKIKKLEGKVTQLELEADKVEQYSRLSRIAPKSTNTCLLHNLDSDVGVVRPMYFSDTVGFVPELNVSEYRSNYLAST